MRIFARISIIFLALALAHSRALAGDEVAVAPVIPSLPVIDPSLLTEALVSLEVHRPEFSQTDIIAIADLSRPSREPRLYLLDQRTGEVTALVTTHGQGSDPYPSTGHAVQVSNARGSLASSKGAYRLSDRYFSVKYRMPAIRLDGLDDTNSQARCRCILIHAANRPGGINYASPAWIADHGQPDTSEGCLALSNEDLQTVLRVLPRGSFLYVGPASLPVSFAVDSGSCPCPADAPRQRARRLR